MIRQNPEILWLMLNPLTSNSSFTITNYYLSYKIWSPSLTLIFYRSIPSNDLHHCFLPLFMLILASISCWEAALCLIFRTKIVSKILYLMCELLLYFLVRFLSNFIIVNLCVNIKHVFISCKLMHTMVQFRANKWCFSADAHCLCDSLSENWCW